MRSQVVDRGSVASVDLSVCLGVSISVQRTCVTVYVCVCVRALRRKTPLELLTPNSVEI